jgi:MarR family transcriptional regulator, organic hydroperoxide resistance regulator
MPVEDGRLSSPLMRERLSAAPLTELRYLILAAQRHGSRMLADRLREVELTPPQAEVLDVLATRAPLTLAELGRLLVCENGSPSRLVESLVRRGLVRREPGREDRRVVSLSLTPEGTQALAGASDDAVLRDFVTSRLTSADVTELTGLLRKLLSGTPGGHALEARFPTSRE